MIKSLSYKKYSRVISHDTEEWCKVERKNDFWFQIWHDKFGKFLPNHSKAWKFDFNGLFLSKVYRVAEKVQRNYLSWNWRVIQIWINSELVVSKMSWGIGWTFIRPLKSEKLCFDELFLTKVHGIWHPPSQKDGGNNFFALAGLYCGEPLWEETIWGGCCFLVLRGGHLRFNSLHSSLGKSAWS